MNWKRLLNDARRKSETIRPDAKSRNSFESDYGRIIFSPAVRRMHDKTQFFPLTTDDNIHSRLTHSMEVMSVGYSLGVKLCMQKERLKGLEAYKYEKLIREIPIILKNSCLVHDIGNPPFGHFGETIIKSYFEELFSKKRFCLSDDQKLDFTQFDGNAQGFRVLTKLQVLNDLNGCTAPQKSSTI